MKTFVLSLLSLGMLAGSAGNRLRAEPPSSAQGKVLILKNEYTMEGDIERVGDRYRLRRGSGETWLPAQRVLCLVGSLREAYVYLRSRINLDDPDERLRMARWCKLRGLPQEAMSELKAAADLRPDHAETQRLLQRWRQAAITPPAAKPAIAPSPPPVVDNELPPVEVTSESLGLFATRVQPILMNTCARCHATGNGGKFRLIQAYESGLSDRRTLERNLAAVLAQVNLTQPEASRLLIKAISDHAHTGQAPLRDRQSQPYRTLENWVRITVENNPHLREALPASTAAPAAGVFSPPPPEAKGKTTAGLAQPATRAEPSQWGADARPVSVPGPPLPSTPVPTPLPAKTNPSTVPLPSLGPADPYDPEPFNRKTHPEAKAKDQP